MGRGIVFSVVLVMGLLLAFTAQAGPVLNENNDTYTWSTPEDFTTKFWMEKFFGGGPGKPGNVLMAIGEGFVFQNAVLESVSELKGEMFPSWCIPLGGSFAYETTYTGGMLTLNSSGPWLKKGSLKATDVEEATNISCHDSLGNLLGFQLTMGGQFDKSIYTFGIEATFTVTPDNYQIKTDAEGVVFQRGYYFGATITLGEAI